MTVYGYDIYYKVQGKQILVAFSLEPKYSNQTEVENAASVSIKNMIVRSFFGATVDDFNIVTNTYCK
jgi:hypothetical protein